MALSTPMKTWIDERSFDQLTEAAIPTGKYKSTVDMILRDQTLFRNDNTIYDSEVYKMSAELEFLRNQRGEIVKRIKESDERRSQKEKELIAFREFVERKAPQLQELQTQEEVSRYNARTKKLGVLEKTFASMDRNHKLLVLEQLDIDDRIQVLDTLYPILEEVRMWTAKRFVSLNRASQEYKRNQNLEKLQKSVHWICEYGDKMVERASRHMPDYLDKIMTKTPTRVETWLSSSVGEEETSTTTEDF